MRGIIRGLPATALLCFGLLLGCSQDASFTERSIESAAQTENLVRRSCPGDGADSITCVASPPQLAIDPADADVGIGQPSLFRAYLVSFDGTRIDVTNKATWSVEPKLAGNVERGALVAFVTGKMAINAQLDGLMAVASANALDGRVRDPELTLEVAGHSSSYSGPSGLPIDVSWSAEGVKSCSLSTPEGEIDRRLSAQVKISILRSGKVTLACISDNGDELIRMVEVSLTKPTIIMTINGQPGDVTVVAGSQVDLEWASANTSQCALKWGPSAISSALAGELSLTVTTGTTLIGICHDQAGNVVEASLNIRTSYESELRFAAGHSERLSGKSESRPVSIIFALDVTGSMASQIDTVKSGIRDFVLRLGSEGYAPRIGIIPFRDKVPVPGDSGDVPEGRLDLTDDLEAVKKFVGLLYAKGGGDANEASLAALREAMLALREGEKRHDAVKIIMLVSDQPGHNGAVTTDCSLSPVTGHFASLSSTEQRSFKLFYSVPQSGSACSGFKTAEAQMVSLRSQILAGEPDPEKRGGLIPWPFAATNLVEDVGNLLVKVTPDIELACLNRSATITLAGEPVFTAEFDLPTVFSQYRSEGATRVARTLSESDYLRFVAGAGQVQGERCCVSVAAALAGDFGTCVEKSTFVSNVTIN